MKEDKKIEQYKKRLERYRIKQLDKNKNMTIEEKKSKSLNKFSNKMKILHEKDEKFYEEIWNTRPHFCENCGKYLGKDFRKNNRIISLFRYAHILPKSIYPYLRHYSDNLMLLCLNCHTEFDNSSKEIKEKMKIFNLKKIENLKELHHFLKNNMDKKYK